MSTCFKVGLNSQEVLFFSFKNACWKPDETAFLISVSTGQTTLTEFRSLSPESLLSFLEKQVSLLTLHLPAYLLRDLY